MEEGLSWMLVLDQIKRKLFNIIAIIGLGFIVTFAVSDRIIKKITDDLLPMEIISTGAVDPCLVQTQLISTSPTEVVMVRLQISLLFGLALAVPYIAYLILQRLKRRFYISPVSILLWSVAALILFETGFALTYFVILPQAYAILVLLTTSANVLPLFSINQFMFFTVISLLVFSLSFEFPLVITWLTIRGLINVQTLKEKRKYVYVLIVFIAAIVTADPTPVSQLLLSGPLIFLYEVSIVVSSIVKKYRKG